MFLDIFFLFSFFLRQGFSVYAWLPWNLQGRLPSNSAYFCLLKACSVIPSSKFEFNINSPRQKQMLPYTRLKFSTLGLRVHALPTELARQLITSYIFINLSFELLSVEKEELKCYFKPKDLSTFLLYTLKRH